MGKALTLLKPQLKHQYLKNAVAERVEYIDVPDGIGLLELRSDVKNGAVHMKELEHLITKKKEPRYIIINAENEEQAYMAVSYLASCFAKKHQRISKEDELGDSWLECDLEEERKPESITPPDNYDDYEEEKWVETAYHIPVLKVQDFGGLFNQDLFAPYPIGNHMIGAEGKQYVHRPYWYECRQEAVCIDITNSVGFGFGRDISDILQDALEFFGENDKVYLINMRQETYHPFGFGDGFGDDFDSGLEDEEHLVEENPLKNQILLSFAADEATVRFEKEAEKKKYYKNVFCSWLVHHAIKINKGFKYDAVLNIIVLMAKGKVCSMIEKVLLYAIKEMETTEGLTLTNADFAFVDHFVRSYGGEKKDKSLKPAREQLEQDLVGMDAVKQQVIDIVNIMKFNKIREKMGIRGSQYHNTHLMLGAPGTAKTTVAKLMGQIMVEEKLLSDNRFICVNGAELKGMYVGHSAPKVKSLFENNDIIVIDEAYSIVDMRGETDSFSNEAIAQMVIELENHATDKLVIFAGYGGKDVSERNNRMKPFLDANPGIKSRINSTFYFESYQADEMVEIFKKIAQNEHYQIEKGAEAALWEYFESRRNDSNFGNGREARSLLEASLLEMSRRVFEQRGKTKLTKTDVKFVHVEDIKKAIGRTRAANRVQEGRKGKEIGFRRIS